MGDTVDVRKNATFTNIKLQVYFLIIYMVCVYIYKERKTFFLNEQKSRDAAAKKYRYKRSRDK